MKIVFTLLFFLAVSYSIYAQTKISGRITDNNNQPLPGANIYLQDTYDGTTSDTDGSFSFSTDEEGAGVLVISFVGYKTVNKDVALDGADKFFEMVLEEKSKELGAVVISAGTFEASDENKAVILRPLDIVTTAGASADIYGALQTLPGTTPIGEAEGLFVRGGSASETRTIIDEMAVQNPFYTSVPDIPSRGRFSPFLFKGTVFSTGGYSAQYGQALSSVLVLKTQDLPTKTQSAVSLMAVGLGGSHVQRWENTSLAFEGGYYNLAPYFDVQKQRTDWDKAPESFEGSLNFRQKISDTGILKAFSSYSYGDLSLYSQNLDMPTYKEFFRLKGGNFFFNSNLREILWDDWAVFGGYSFSIDEDNFDIDINKLNQKDKFHAGKLTVQKNLFANSFLTFGGDFQKLDHSNKFNEQDSKLSETYAAGYLEADVFFTNDFAGRFGVRSEYSGLLDKTNIAPRVSLAYRLGVYDQINFAYGQFFQTPGQDFLLQTSNFEYERADHYILNYQYIGTNRTFRIEVYYKDYNQLAKGTVLTHPYFNLPPVPFSNDGKGYAKGIDVFWRDSETIKYTDYWISYSYLDTKREFRNYPTLAFPTFATPHTFSVVAKHWLPSISSMVGMTYSFATGRPYFNPNNPEFLGDRAKNYQNLSLNVSYLTSLFNSFAIVFFSVDNLIGYNNIYGYNYSSDGTVRAPVLAPALRTAFIGMFISLGETNPY
ncbi:MAG: TonB-dependent receptor [Ignavibacteriaceae bacterium]